MTGKGPEVTASFPAQARSLRGPTVKDLLGRDLAKRTTSSLNLLLVKYHADANHAQIWKKTGIPNAVSGLVSIAPYALIH